MRWWWHPLPRRCCSVMHEMDTPKDAELPLPTRVAVLEAKVRLLSIVMKWLVGLMFTSLIAKTIGVKL